MSDAPSLTLCDATLRDGSHAYQHQITAEQIQAYASAAEAAGVAYLEVGHGNGLGASSLQVGESLLTDEEMLTLAKEPLKHTKLSVHIIPGFATIQRDIQLAMDLGVELFRIGCHCTEADVCERHISFLRQQSEEVWGVLMMSHMASAAVLLEEAKKMQSYGAQGIVLMDSAGAYLPEEVKQKVGLLVENLEVAVGFHAHQNLGLAIANSLVAVEAGARILDGTAKGFGAGAGNAPLELLVAVLQQKQILTGVDLYAMLDAANLVERLFGSALPTMSDVSIVSGLAGVFSGFAKPVKRVAEQFQVDPRDIFVELGKRRVVGGQEDLIVEVASALAAGKETI